MQLTTSTSSGRYVRDLSRLLTLIVPLLAACGGSDGGSNVLPEAEVGRSILRREVLLPTSEGMQLREIEYFAEELLVYLPEGMMSVRDQGRSCSIEQAEITSLELRRELEEVLGVRRIRSLGRMEGLGGAGTAFLLRGVELDPYDYAQQPGGQMFMAEPNYVLRLEQGQVAGANRPGALIDPSLPSDARFSQQWSLDNRGQTSGKPGADIDAIGAWRIEQGDPDVVIAMVDTGIDYTHRDLQSRMWTNEGEVPNNGLDDDGNGYVDDVYGYDFYDDKSDPWDDHRHGTHTAGIAAAAWNHRVGIVGVAPHCRVMALKIFDVAGSGSTAAAAEAIIYATNMGAKITSNSYGGPLYSQALDLAFEYAFENDVVSIASAGNGSTDSASYPAALKNVLSVAATDDDDQPAEFTNYGEFVDLAAPGVSVLSTVPYLWNASGYALFSGTSMAAPHVAGIAALIRSHDPSATNRAVQSALMTAVDPLDTALDLGTGRCNAKRALFLNHNSDLVVEATTIVESAESTLTISGTAGGDDFLRYDLDVGTGSYPAQWTALESRFQPVSDGVLGTIDLANLPTGASRVRVRVTDSAGRSVADSKPFVVDNFGFTQPRDFDVLRKGGLLELRGNVSVLGFTGYQVEWRPYILNNGYPSPSGPWTSAGIVLENGGLQQVSNNKLATFDTQVVTGTNRCHLRLSAPGSNFEEVLDLYLDPNLQQGWPIRISHDPSYDGDLSVLDPLIVDLDRNGAAELYSLMTGVFYGHDAAGVLLPGFPVNLPTSSGETYTTSALTVGDVDEDGFEEILFAGLRDQTLLIYAYEADGILASGFPLAFTYGGSPDSAVLRPNSSVVMADIDADGQDEIVFQAFDILIIAERNGMLKTGQLVHLRPGAGDSCNRNSLATSVDSTPAVADIDGDAELEIVVFHEAPDCSPGAQGVVTVFNPNGSIVPGWPRTTTYAGAGASPVIGNLDGLGGNEIVIASATRFRTGGLHVFDSSGNVLPGWPQYEATTAFPCSPTLVDLDEDGDLEIMVADGDNDFIFLFEHTGIWHGPGYLSGISSPYAVAVVDVNQDGSPDITASANAYPNSGTMDYGTGAQAWSSSGQVISGFPMVTESNTWVPMQVLDIDGDGFVEGIGSSFKDQGAGVWTNQDFKRRGSIYVWELPYAVNPNAKSPWPTFHGNLQRTGYYE